MSEARVTLTPLRRIGTPRGDVLHAMKRGDPGDAGFGEAYLSGVHEGLVKGWKKHHSMTLNLVAVHGSIQVTVRDAQGIEVMTCVLGPDDPGTHARLTVAPGLWVAFGGKASGTSLLLNIASLPHDPNESENRPIDAFEWAWERTWPRCM